MDKAYIVISGNPTFQAPVTVHIHRHPIGNNPAGMKEVLARPKIKFDTKEEPASLLSDPSNFPLEGQNDNKAKYRHDDQRLYQILGEPKGRVLLVINEFSDEASETAESKDLHVMIRLWEKIGCEVTLLQDVTGDRLSGEVKDFTEAESGASFIVVIVLSHGRECDLVVGKQKAARVFENVVEVMTESSMTNGQPKLIIFQMTRGDSLPFKTEGVADEDITWMNRSLKMALRERFGETESDSIPVVKRDLSPNREASSPNNRDPSPNRSDSSPNMRDSSPNNRDPSPNRRDSNTNRRDSQPIKDVMLACAAPPAWCESFHNLDNGNLFIHAMNEVFLAHAEIHGVMELLEMVKGKLKEQNAHLATHHTFGDKILHLFPEHLK